MTLPYPVDEGQTHYDGCWRYPGHHNCAVSEVSRLQQENGTLSRMVSDEVNLRDRNVADLSAARGEMAELTLDRDAEREHKDTQRKLWTNSQYALGRAEAKITALSEALREQVIARDRVWCAAMVGLMEEGRLDSRTVEMVTARFNELRPDAAAALLREGESKT